jgi:hypothetical protein
MPYNTNELAQARWEHNLLLAKFVQLQLEIMLNELKYNANQLRAPRGTPIGGQWIAVGSNIENNVTDKEPVVSAEPNSAKPLPSSVGKTSKYKPPKWYKLAEAVFAKETVKDLKKHSELIEQVALENNIDPNLIRGVITNERITSIGGGNLEALKSKLGEYASGLSKLPDSETISEMLYQFEMQRETGTYGPAQLGKRAREYSGLTIEEAMTYEGAIIGAGNWLGQERKILIEEGFADPTNGQIATRYNSGDANSGLVVPYGSRVEYLIDKYYYKP